MTASELARARRQLGLTQKELAERLKTTRVSIARYEAGLRRIPGVIEFAVQELSRATTVPMLGVVAAGRPIEAVPQNESVDIPRSMLSQPAVFAVQITGESMREDAILPGDLVVIRKQSTAQDGDRVVALLNGEATIKKYRRRKNGVELCPVNSAMRPIPIKPADDLRIQGVVIGLIRHYR